MKVKLNNSNNNLWFYIASVSVLDTVLMALAPLSGFVLIKTIYFVTGFVMARYSIHLHYT